MALEQKHVEVLREHLPYELNMLDHAASAWRIFQRPRDRAEGFAQMSAIEMFWVRARTLHEFSRKTTGLIAEQHVQIILQRKKSITIYGNWAPGCVTSTRKLAIS